LGVAHEAHSSSFGLDFETGRHSGGFLKMGEALCRLLTFMSFVCFFDFERMVIL
jgi:hypothetical protein